MTQLMCHERSLFLSLANVALTAQFFDCNRKNYSMSESNRKHSSILEHQVNNECYMHVVNV